IAGAVSVLLAAIGVHSVAAFSMARRTREIGIRLTLGARPARLVQSGLAGECAAIAVRLLLGVAGAALISRVLAPARVATDPAQPSLIVAAAATLAAAAAVASYIPARRAARTDPVAALRVE